MQPNQIFNAAQSEVAAAFSQPHPKEYYNISPLSPQADHFPVYPSTQSVIPTQIPSISPTSEHQFPPNVNYHFVLTHSDHLYCYKFTFMYLSSNSFTIALQV